MTKYIADLTEKPSLVEADSVLVGDSTVVGAGSGKRHSPKQSATPSSLALRTAGGQLKASDAVAADDLVPRSQLLNMLRDGGVYNPQFLFDGGVNGALYDVSVLSSMFQDAAGTIPVTADGEPVGLIKDLSGNGNHASQATATARPVYRTDGTYHWLESDGVDDKLVTGNIDLTSTDELHLSAAIGVLEPRSNNSLAVSVGAGGGTVGAAFIRTGDGSQDNIRIAFNSSGTLNQTLTTPIPYPSDMVISARFKCGVAYTDAIKARLNSTLLTNTESTPQSGTFQNLPFQICAHKGKFFASVLTGKNPVQADIEATERYLARRSGVTLA